MIHRGVALAAAGVLGIGSIFACSSDDDAELPPPEPDPVCAEVPESFRFEHGTKGDGAPDPFGAKAAGQSRAGKVRDASQIVQHASARNKVRPGDFVLVNDRIAAYIEAEGESDGYDTFGGELLALETVGPDGRPTGVSQYNETLILLSRQMVRPDRVTILADGSDGKAAIVRASGVLASIPFLDTFRALLPDEYGFPAALDYVLEPGQAKVTLRMHLANTKPELVDFLNKQYFGFFQANRNQPFTEGFGFGASKGESPWIAYESMTTASAFLVKAHGVPIRTEIGLSGFDLFSFKGLTLESCAKKSVDYADFVVSAPGLDNVLETNRATYGEPAWREVRGVVKETDGTLLPGALVHATAPNGKYLTRARTDAAGAFALHVPSGAAQLTATLKGWAIPAATPAPAGSTTVDVVLPKRATIEVNARDATTSEAIPVRVQIIPVTPLAAAPDAFGVIDAEAGGRLWQEYALSGKAVLAVPPGQHRVVVSRGYEYELYDAPATATAGQTTVIDVPLARSVDSPGVMCADFHIHSHFSADSADLPELKVKGAIADGLEIPVSSEHEWVIDFQPIVEKLGMTKWAHGLSAEELTTFSWGHFGVVPLLVRPDSVNNGAVSWVGKKPAEIFKTVNELPEKPVLIVHHPRNSGLQGYFETASYDPAKGTGDPELWSDAFGAIEVFNDSDYESNRSKSVADWYSLLDRNKTYWAVGSSDSHHQTSSPVGYPRTCLRFGHDDPAILTPESVRDALRAGAAVISGGFTMTVVGPNGVAPGGTGTKGVYTITVSSPGWVSAAGTSLEVIIDGATTQTLPLTALAGAGPGRKYQAIVDVAPTQSRARHYVVFHVKGGGDLGPLHPGRKPFAVSNPIFFGP
jgi:hypothetical protein